MEWSAWKPVVSALVLPPVPGLILILLGARLILPKRGWGYLTLFLGVMLIWFSSCNVTARWLLNGVLKPPVVLDGGEMLRLKQVGRAESMSAKKGARPVAPTTAIVVLGGGREPLAREYGVSDLSPHSAERLRFGIWLSRQTGLPLAFSGGVGWSQQRNGGVISEAEVAARVAQQHYGWPLRWTETHSADTRQNAQFTINQLAAEGVSEIVLVTEAYHMPRALRSFQRAAQQVAVQQPSWPVVKVTPAPMAFWSAGERSGLDWLPSTEGLANVRQALHEVLGLAAGL
mgnify:CR=1 FL=1